jgi:hypothetical protein
LVNPIATLTFPATMGDGKGCCSCLCLGLWCCDFEFEFEFESHESDEGNKRRRRCLVFCCDKGNKREIEGTGNEERSSLFFSESEH